jgi:two-component system LytT family response regulator
LNRRIKTLIVDDEPLARDALRVLLREDPDIEIIGECRDGSEAVTMMREQSPELVFLDIQMPNLDGFEVLARTGLERSPVVVFVTAHNRYALRAFEAHALDYLLKPFDHERFNAALVRAKRQVQLQDFGDVSRQLLRLLEDLRGEQKGGKQEHRQGGKHLERLAIKAHGKILLMKVAEVDWIEAAGDYVRLHAGARSYLLRETMSDLTAKLNPAKFLRIHRSTIVNIDRMKDIQPLFKGDHVVTLQDGTKLKLSRSCRDKLRDVLGQSI